ncbi:MAG: HIT domain-containing protein [Methylococcaceae bacterium]|jgi:diadenosine tetraphosphate (Ap4A) HIT family hydrolase
MSFQLHPQLQRDCIALGEFQLCQLLVVNDSQYPWFMLVPQKPEIKEIFQLSPAERAVLMEESCTLAENLKIMFQGDKINIAAIGNLVPQLHIHHVVRYQTDNAWPAPIWGKFPAIPYSPMQLTDLSMKVRQQLGDKLKYYA